MRLLERDHASGVLQVGEDGALELANGIVTHAESPYAPAPQRLAGSPGPEMLALIAVVDAAYFLLASPAEPRFRSGDRLALPMPPCELTVSTLVHEYERRRTLLSSRWPHGRLDHAPVVPVRRLRRQRVILTGLEAEILLNADERRTPVDLAHHLGRPVFACLLAVHDLAAAGLVETRPEAVPAGAPGGTYEARALREAASVAAGHAAGVTATTRTVAAGAVVAGAATTRPVMTGAGTTGAATGAEPAGPPGQTGPPAAGEGLDELPTRRRRGVEVPEWEPPDLALLGRLRTALEELT
ncbi:hypothetical protein [Spirillospora sp. NPDC047279]|uniref:hypothetical protein n=1 Tax=Spirillospora sp. NPDC047279 TaxID=3155478 RepID=UPI0033C62A96